MNHQGGESSFSWKDRQAQWIESSDRRFGDVVPGEPKLLDRNNELYFHPFFGIQHLLKLLLLLDLLPKKNALSSRNKQTKFGKRERGTLEEANKRRGLLKRCSSSCYWDCHQQGLGGRLEGTTHLLGLWSGRTRWGSSSSEASGEWWVDCWFFCYLFCISFS